MASSACKAKVKTNLNPPSNWLRYGAVIFGALLCYGALSNLVEVNMALSLDYWGNFLAGLLIMAAPFVMNYFLTSVLLGTGVFTVVHLFQPNLQNWMNLVIFVLLTILLVQPHRKWIRVLIQLGILAVIGVCLWCVWQEFYRGLEHFIETGKLTDSYLKKRVMTYLPHDFSFYMAVMFLTLSIRQYALHRRRRPVQQTAPKRSDDEDLWGY